MPGSDPNAENTSENKTNPNLVLMDLVLARRAEVICKASVAYKTVLCLFLVFTESITIFQGNCPPCSDSGAEKASLSQSEVPWLLWQRKRKTEELAMGLFWSTILSTVAWK